MPYVNFMVFSFYLTKNYAFMTIELLEKLIIIGQLLLYLKEIAIIIAMVGERQDFIKSEFSNS